MNEMPNRRDFSSDTRLLDGISADDIFAAEEAIIAGILNNNSLAASCGLEPTDFSEPLHQTFYSAIQQLCAGHQIADASTLKPFVPKVVTNLEITPAKYLDQLQKSGFYTIPQEFDAKVQIVKGASMSRQLSREADFIGELAKEGHSLLTLGEEIEGIEQRLKEMLSRFSDTKAVKSPGSQYLAAFNASSRRDGVKGVPIALPEIARVLSEPVFEAGNLYGLLSSSGEGKSSLTMQLIYHAVYEGHPVLFLSYDQSAAQCVRQMIAQVHQISVSQQREPLRYMSQTEQDKCVGFATWINEQPFEIIRCQREGVDRLVAYARRFIKKRANGKTPFIVLDHIGKVKPKNDKLSADRISGDVTVELKALADEIGASVLVLNQRNGESGKRQNPRPIAKDLYGGENARADYDAILTLYRPEKYKKEMEKVAATAADWKIINSVFGSDIDGLAELASIKVRFGDPSIVERVKFEAEYTRYRSNQPERTAELF
ncbi:helicase DnaB [Rhizobium sp. P40RR-XXII]|uniref:DnaB-like helicase C-terminal domain-containing protein n=1 Tax=Rhizobium sp. P40RR-XXII TaxID=2726739 RepID=UPI0014566D47|nr:DnaB-like helicase C-terminal domain-containing protein [Rhizobium sp. P40RR-XXII]NLS19880.1 helicase DnaB [Rhizobium sp. P40RR-XXII]